MWKSYEKSAKDTFLSQWKDVQSGLFVCPCVRAQVFRCFCYYYPHVSPAASVCSTKLCQHVITSIVNVIKHCHERDQLYYERDRPGYEQDQPCYDYQQFQNTSGGAWLL